MADPAAFTWDWRQQPPMDEIAAAIERLSDERLHVYLPDTGTDSYAVVISDRELTAREQERAWLSE